MLHYFLATHCLYIQYLCSNSTYPMGSFTAVANPARGQVTRKDNECFLFTPPSPFLRIRRESSSYVQGEKSISINIIIIIIIISSSSSSTYHTTVLLTAKETNLKFLTDKFWEFKMKSRSPIAHVYTHITQTGARSPIH